MKGTIDIDIGGTFTDCYLTYGDRVVIKKSPTTSYNLSVGFMRVIEESCKELGLPIEDVLKDIHLIRYSTTIAMNKLIERKGPRLGLITTEGFEDVIYVGKGAQWADGLSDRERRNLGRIKKPDPLIPKEMTVGAKERIDSFGRVIRPLDEEDVREKLRYLVDMGAMGFVVCLLWSFINPVHERRIKEIIKEEYPDSYLGSMPVVLSSEVLPKQGEYQRTMTTILNAYLHQSMKEELSGMWDSLRDCGYRGPLMMVHNTGGMAEVFRTVAVNTYNGGPVAGLMGSRFLGKSYNFNNVIVTDMGGTSFDLGLIVEGSTRFYEFRPIVDRWMVGHTMLETKSIGAGGGSIAWINELLGNRLEVGPQSAGSMPGPACYAQGGSEPTVTDADVVLGYINPQYFHGGKKKLNKERAVRAIREKIAKPLGMETEEAALMIKKVVDANMGNIILKETVLRGYDPREFVLFSYGGAGPTHCCGYASYVEIPKIITFPYSPVFCAFGSSTMDMVHIYEKSRRLILISPNTKEYLEDYEEFNSIVEQLQQEAIRDMTGEGFRQEDILFSLEIDMKFGGQIHMKRTLSPRLFLKSPEDVQALYEEFVKEYSQAYSPLSVYPEGGVILENFVLRATVPRPKMELPVFKPKGDNPKKALKGKREVLWEEDGRFRETPVYDYDLLECGNSIEGPAVIEAESTTIVIPQGKKYYLDVYLNGVIEG